MNTTLAECKYCNQETDCIPDGDGKMICQECKIEKNIADKNKDIPTDEILKDIEDSKKEIDLYQRKLDMAEEERNRWEIMKAKKEITERCNFIDKLNIILKFR